MKMQRYKDKIEKLSHKIKCARNIIIRKEQGIEYFTDHNPEEYNVERYKLELLDLRHKYHRMKYRQRRYQRKIQDSD